MGRLIALLVGFSISTAALAAGQTTWLLKKAVMDGFGGTQTLGYCEYYEDHVHIAFSPKMGTTNAEDRAWPLPPEIKSLVTAQLRQSPSTTGGFQATAAHDSVSYFAHTPVAGQPFPAILDLKAYGKMKGFEELQSPEAKKLVEFLDQTCPY